ncbi:energy-coupling factor ABC transporter ATP-binding protein [Anoxybacillus salavatliensis]|uniref:ABC transporter ATP-binding protein n=1 Tax=Anoxybacillus TaxID=150247 RepID=UPI0013D601D2|nr:ABC transporter ATP-binding protein [Anoxybacillus sp. MB8]MCQ5365592.1 energy-coupling factor ABC transporter ATP-binding protein [Anoxybacillus gonensis]
MTSLIHIEQLRLKFPGAEKRLFTDVSLSIKKGEKVLLLGPSGCGKSTLLQVMAGIIPRSIDVPMKAKALHIPKQVGYVFQDPDAQFCMPYVDEEIAFVLENLGVPRAEMKEKIERVLQRVHLRLPHVHVPIQTLSGGMKQRLAIASVLALDPHVLFLDEPTALLDEDGTKAVWETLKEVADDRTVVIVEHKIDHILDFVERIILFNACGEIIADGPTDHIFSTYRSFIAEQGIWYPQVWETYEKPKTAQQPYHESNVLLHVQSLRGFRQKEEKIAVDDVVIRAGEWIAITGENGAGKSTLLQSFMKLIRTEGDMYWQGELVKNDGVLYDHIAFVFQNPEFQFVTNRVDDELAYCLRLEQRPEYEIEEEVERLLRRFHLSAQRHLHPYQLSMGQKRRLSVAASVTDRHRILLLDEPTFGQDAKNTFALLEWLEAYRQQGKAIVMVTHDERIVSQFATRRWVIEKGKLVADETIVPRTLVRGGI